ncbi:hypothetical protein LY632_02220 [Erythrobacter sp. SDW2]|uniref:hypothetical protein n=1 Tax=Erythrobacter sp. SDW2 TaxID=2907154 RepID=UPI001F45724B|nr:hypothetical protein [Erythrobacter sp. SDW2]UIP07236.1 hypothetical protein LY632_02220 [Erythrobacter sp. SDW2]
MGAQDRPDPLLARSVIVTGTHYSTTTLVGALLHTAPEFHLLHEPLNPEPTPSYDSLGPPRWYEYYDDSRWEELHDNLARILQRGPVIPEFLARLGRARSPKQLGQALRYAQRKFPVLLARKPAILKGPFLAFSALTLQQRAGCKVVLCVRHPGAFAESLLRKTDGFCFRDLASQPALMAMLPDEADEIARSAREDRTPLEQAALLWRVVYGFAANHLLPDPRTTLVRQEDFMGHRDATARRLLAFIGGTETAATRRFLIQNFQTRAGDSDRDSYIRRDPRLATMKWRQRLSGEDVKLLQTMTAPLAATFGYGEASWQH